MIGASKTNKSEAPKQILTEVTLTASEAHRLVGICIELIGLCSKVTGKFDPSMGTMIAFARDEALTDAIGIKL
jgi:hypothetical protein